MIDLVWSDVHLHHHHRPLWRNAKKFLKDNKKQIRTLVLNGDIVDFGSISSYPQAGDEPVQVVRQIRMAVKEINEISRFAKRVVFVIGNHEQRWEKYLIGFKAAVLEGLLGLSFEEQMRAQGLSPKVEFYRESPKTPGLLLNGVLLIRHGHKQASRFGNIHLSNRLLNEQPTVSTIVGHHHRAQMAIRTYLDKQVFALANPHMSGDHDYTTLPNWQTGFTVIEWIDAKTFCPYIVVADKRGRFAYGGRVYS